MIRTTCESCGGAVLVGEGALVEFAGAVCKWCNDKAQLAITAQFGEAAAVEFKENETNFNGKRCAIARVRCL